MLRLQLGSLHTCACQENLWCVHLLLELLALIVLAEGCQQSCNHSSIRATDGSDSQQVAAALLPSRVQAELRIGH